MVITSVPIRATIEFGGLIIKTPYILSFSVTKTRNSKSTFSTSLKVLSSELANMEDNAIVIYAGEKNREIKIFTGYILSTRPTICFDDPNFTVLNLSGSDALFLLEGEKYTRRQMHSKKKWAIIDSVVRKAGKSQKFELNYQPLQTVDEDLINNDEKKNKSNNTQDLNSIGNTNLPTGVKAFNFNFSEVKLVGE